MAPGFAKVFKVDGSCATLAGDMSKTGRPCCRQPAFNACAIQASKLDRYLQACKKGKLQGLAIHDYRANFKPTADHYDFGNDNPSAIHPMRLLLKAEPQSGKTGMGHPCAAFQMSPHTCIVLCHVKPCIHSLYSSLLPRRFEDWSQIDALSVHKVVQPPPCIRAVLHNCLDSSLQEPI